VLSVLDAGLTIANSAAYSQLAEGHQGSAEVAHLSVLTSLAASITPVVAGAVVAGASLPGLDVLLCLFALSAAGRAGAGVVLLLPARRGRRHAVRVVSASRTG
jgi:hypothetical protein